MRTVTAAVVLAGSHRSARSVEDLRVPSLLLPLAHARVVDHLLGWLREGGVGRVVICANESAELLRETLGDGSRHGFDFYYCVDREPRGPAGCCRDATELLPAARYVVVEGAVLPDFTLEDVLTRHDVAGAGATVVVSQDDRGETADNVQVPAGVYVFEARTLAAVPAVGFQDIKEMLLPRLYQQQESVLTYVAARPSPRLLGLDAYFAVQAWLLQRMCADLQVPPGYIRMNGTFRHETANLAADTEIIGPVMLGPGTHVARGATLIGPVVVGRDCVMEKDSLVQRSILWDRCRVEAGARVDHCLLTSETRLEAGLAVSGRVCSGELEPVAE